MVTPIEENRKQTKRGWDMNPVNKETPLIDWLSLYINIKQLISIVLSN